jgi:hypothetical protein
MSFSNPHLLVLDGHNNHVILEAIEHAIHQSSISDQNYNYVGCIVIIS